VKFSVIIPYRRAPGRSRLYFWVLAWWEANFPDAQICVADTADIAFNRGGARNHGVEMSAWDLLCLADADTVPQVAAVSESLEAVAEREAPWALPYRTYYNLGEEATDRVLRYPVGSSVPEPGTEDVEHTLTDSVAGCVILRRDLFDEVGGYDPRFMGWGGEDVAFARTLDLVAGARRRSDSHLCHLWHPIPERSTFDGPQWPANGSLQRRYQAASNAAQVLDVRFQQ